jgi:prevent-host-death family protein
MAIRLSEADVAARLGDVLGRVCQDEIPTIIERDGQPVAVLISPAQWDDFQKVLMDRFFEAVDRIRALNEDTDPDEVERIVTEVVEEVRQENYERRQQQARRSV